MAEYPALPGSSGREAQFLTHYWQKEKGFHQAAQEY